MSSQNNGHNKNDDAVRAVLNAQIEGVAGRRLALADSLKQLQQQEGQLAAQLDQTRMQIVAHRGALEENERHAGRLRECVESLNHEAGDAEDEPPPTLEEHDELVAKS